jgi:hypothetical protein
MKHKWDEIDCGILQEMKRRRDEIDYGILQAQIFFGGIAIAGFVGFVGFVTMVVAIFVW